MQRRAQWNDGVLELTSTEFNLLEVLIRHAGTPVSKNTLSEQALVDRWQNLIATSMYTPSSLRHKLGKLDDGRSCVQTVYRVGYQLIKD